MWSRLGAVIERMWSVFGPVWVRLASCWVVFGFVFVVRFPMLLCFGYFLGPRLCSAASVSGMGICNGEVDAREAVHKAGKMGRSARRRFHFAARSDDTVGFLAK